VDHRASVVVAWKPEDMLIPISMDAAAVEEAEEAEEAMVMEEGMAPAVTPDMSIMEEV
jgi:hypothetical protein